MELQECINDLNAEKIKKVTSRFPCRVLLLHSLNDYCNAVVKLKSLCDREVSLDELFSSADVMPAYDKLPEKIMQGEWLCLPGVSEYLRLFYTSEERSNRFANLWHSIVDSSNTGRIIIPLWNCDYLWYTEALKFNIDERQKDFVYSIPSQKEVSEKLDITVFSALFNEYTDQIQGEYNLIDGLREWYAQMLDKPQIPTNYGLLTKQSGSVSSSLGDISIKTINSTYQFVRENLRDSFDLTEDIGSPELLSEIFEEAVRKVSLKEAILNRFNIKEFNGLNVMANWTNFPKGKRQLLKLWYRINPDDTYLCNCFNKYEIEDVEEHILLDIFDLMPSHNEWIAEYQKLQRVLNLKRDQTFFEKLSSLSSCAMRFEFLVGDTREERIYILKTIGELIKQGVVLDVDLKNLYPALTAYLSSIPNSIESVFNEYITDYKKYKLSNTLPESEDSFFRGIRPDDLQFRYSVINQNIIINNTVVLWIDGFGFEYLSLLLDKLSKIEDGVVISCELTQASLPTETKFNKQWTSGELPYEKLDKLDKLAHKGVVDEPDYYSCIEEQLAFFDKVSDKVNELLQKFERVIITGDHGASRLAARFFHSRDGFPVPKDATPHSHGRYCSIKSKPKVLSEDLVDIDSIGQHYLVFKSYNHFSISGYATGKDEKNAVYGEIHGGASPEEMIVPVVVFDRKISLPLTVKWSENKSESRLKRKVATAELEFNKEIKKLVVKIENVEAVVTDIGDGKKWKISFENANLGVYEPVIVADGNLVNIDKPLTITSALGETGDFL